MIEILLLVAFVAAIVAALILRGKRKEQLGELIAEQVIESRHCASERPGVRRFFDETLIALGAIDAALAAQADRGLEQLARQVSVRPDAPRSQQLLEAAQTAVREWTRAADTLDDADLEEMSSHGVDLEAIAAWGDRPPPTAQELRVLAGQMRVIEEALRVRGWGRVLRPGGEG
jgi:hypothetical protein